MPGLGTAMNAVALLRRSTNMQDKSIEEQIYDLFANKGRGYKGITRNFMDLVRLTDDGRAASPTSLTGRSGYLRIGSTGWRDPCSASFWP